MTFSMRTAKYTEEEITTSIMKVVKDVKNKEGTHSREEKSTENATVLEEASAEICKKTMEEEKVETAAMETDDKKDVMEESSSESE